MPPWGEAPVSCYRTPATDRYLHLSPGNLFIIGGRPSAGKTALSLQIACEMAGQGLQSAVGLETDPDTLTTRIIANRLAVPGGRKGQANPPG